MPLFLLLVCGDQLTQRHEILSQNTRDSRLSYRENLKSLSHPSSNWSWVVTDGWTGEQTDTKTEFSLLIVYLLCQKSGKKIVLILLKNSSNRDQNVVMSL